jgi:hypothetical protein
MKLTVTRLDQGKYETVVTRDDGAKWRELPVGARLDLRWQ